jgi:hypothetical protein
MNAKRVVRKACSASVFIGDGDMDEPVRVRRTFTVEFEGSRPRKSQSTNDVSAKKPLLILASQAPSKKRIRNALIGVSTALERHDRLNALAIANRNQLPDDMRARLGLGASLTAAEISRRQAALAAATQAHSGQ